MSPHLHVHTICVCALGRREDGKSKEGIVNVFQLFTCNSYQFGFATYWRREPGLLIMWSLWSVAPHILCTLNLHRTCYCVEGGMVILKT